MTCLPIYYRITEARTPLLTMSWSGQMEYVWRQQAVGSMAYIWWYTTFMLVFAGIPYTEELVRCWRAARVRQADA